MSVTIGIQTQIKLEVVICITCGCHFGVPVDFMNGKRQTGGNFCCPSGHSMTFGGNENDRLKKKLADEETRRAQAEAATLAERERANRNWRDGREAVQATERKLSAQKGVTTRLKNRISKGVCPCCNRTFANLARHMAGQHPEFATEGDEA
jgi:hypothetical protein